MCGMRPAGDDVAPRTMTDNDGTYQRTWIARRTGIDRVVVDALDSATLLLARDNYRTNEVGSRTGSSSRLFSRRASVSVCDFNGAPV